MGPAHDVSAPATPAPTCPPARRASAPSPSLLAALSSDVASLLRTPDHLTDLGHEGLAPGTPLVQILKPENKFHVKFAGAFGQEGTRVLRGMLRPGWG